MDPTRFLNQPPEGQPKCFLRAIFARVIPGEEQAPVWFQFNVSFSLQPIELEMMARLLHFARVENQTSEGFQRLLQEAGKLLSIHAPDCAAKSKGIEPEGGVIKP